MRKKSKRNKMRTKSKRNKMRKKNRMKFRIFDDILMRQIEDSLNYQTTSDSCLKQIENTETMIDLLWEKTPLNRETCRQLTNSLFYDPHTIKHLLDLERADYNKKNQYNQWNDYRKKLIKTGIPFIPPPLYDKDLMILYNNLMM